MTPNEAYDRIHTHFSRPGAGLSKSYLDPEAATSPAAAMTCYYRWGRVKSARRRCPVGVLIPDEMYSAAMDSAGSLEALIRVYPSLKPKLGIEGCEDDPSFNFLSLAQQAHDNPRTQTVERFLGLLDGIALGLGLIAALPKADS